MKTLFLSLILISSAFCAEPTQAPAQKVFKFSTSDNKLVWSATAFYISPTRLLTAAHTLSHKTWEHYIKKDGIKISVKVVKIDYQADIALLESDVQNADFFVLLQTNPVTAIGFEHDSEVLSERKGGAGESRELITNNVMVEGMSGCPIVTASGVVIGMGVRGNGRDKCISVPASVLVKFADK